MSEIRIMCKALNSNNGVYIWTHIPSGKKYVGQAINLSTRLRAYYSGAELLRNSNLINQLILETSNMSEFILKVYFLPSSVKNININILEQYFLFHKEFNLNIARLSMFPGSTPRFPLFMYNIDKTILYYSSFRQTDFIDILGIPHVTFTKHLNEGSLYLGKFLFTREIVNEAILSHLSTDQLIEILKLAGIEANTNKINLGSLRKESF